MGNPYDELARWLDSVSGLQVVWFIVGTCAALGLFWKWAKAALPVVVRLIATINALSDLPEKLILVDEIHHEVRPNTGTSMNDALRRVEAEQSRQAGELSEQTQQIASLRKLMLAGDDELSKRVGNIESTLNPKKEKP